MFYVLKEPIDIYVDIEHIVNHSNDDTNHLHIKLRKLNESIKRFKTVKYMSFILKE